MVSRMRPDRRQGAPWGNHGPVPGLAARRRTLLAGAAGLTASALAGARDERSEQPGPVTLFLAGDVMTGRGLDQALPHSVDPRLYESHMTSARGYVELAEQANGPLPLPLDFAYPWGDALTVLDETGPALRWVNLETAVTERGEPDPRKGIHYRMHPGNVACLQAAGLDGVSLANNHALDWGRVGLADTLDALENAGIATAGAGADGQEAMAPAVFDTPAGRVLVFAACTGFSGVPRSWTAGPGRPGVQRVDLTDRSVAEIGGAVRRFRRPGDRVVLSLHWGDNWGHAIDEDIVNFGHRLIEDAGIDLLHGHSSHHPRAIERYRDRLILYGCGDFLNDYEGIQGPNARYRGDLTAMYFPTLEEDGGCGALDLVPMRIHRFRLQRASAEESEWLRSVLDRESRDRGVRVVPGHEGRLKVVPA